MKTPSWIYDIRFVLNEDAKLDFYSETSQRVDMSLHSDGRHVTLLGHIISILSQSIFALTL